MRRFAEEYSLDEIGQQAIDQLPWGHNITLMYEVPDKKARGFYTQKTKTPIGQSTSFEAEPSNKNAVLSGIAQKHTVRAEPSRTMRFSSETV